MRLCNVSSVGDTGIKDILLDERGIAGIKTANQTETGSQNEIRFEDAIAFPGLINSHDHLDFDLFPQMGNRVYQNYREWGNDIHMNNKEQIHAVLSVPQAVRTRWGMYRNLLNGFTTVVNHGEPLVVHDHPVTVWQSPVSIHSVGFDKRWRWKLNRPAWKKIYNIHVGEGTDSIASAEIDSLLRWNLFKRKLVAVHGVAMNEEQAASFLALVWCPVSNEFLLQRTAGVDLLKQYTNILFGSDSTLTAGWDIWEHLRIARQTGMLTDKELYEAITTRPARVWGMRRSGSVQTGYSSDLVIARRKKYDTMDSFFETTPMDILLVVHKGVIQLFDRSLIDQLGWLRQEDFSAVSLGQTAKYIRGDIGATIKEIERYLPGRELPITLL